MSTRPPARDIRTLDWREQLARVKLKLQDPERYEREVLGVVKDPELRRMIERLAFLVQEEARTPPSLDAMPLTVVPHWVAIDGWIDLDTHHRELDRLGMAHQFFINTVILKAPVLVIRVEDKVLTRMVSLCGGSSRAGLHVLRAKTYLDLDRGQHEPVPESTDDFQAIRAKAADRYGHLMFEDLVGHYPVVAETNRWARLWCLGEVLLYWAWRQKLGACLFAPMFPRRLTTERGWEMRGWHFLI